MRTAQLNDMVRGWFVGDFQPSVLATENAEIGVQQYKAGDKEARHHHKVATEVTLILNGLVRMNNVLYGAGTIVVINPNESTDFEAVEDSTTVVVKIPGAKNDKYLG